MKAQPQCMTLFTCRKQQVSKLVLICNISADAKKATVHHCIIMMFYILRRQKMHVLKHHYFSVLRQVNNHAPWVMALLAVSKRNKNPQRAY